MNQRQQELLQISRRYAALPADKRQILRSRLRENGVDISRLRMEPFADRPDRLPLSHGQERLWFLWRLEPQSGVNNVSGAMRLDGELDRSALRLALRNVVERHESLRMHVEEVDGVGWQVFAAEPEFDFTECNLNSLSDAERDEVLQSQMREVAAAPFDLERGPLVRARLIRLAERTHVLALSLHHIVSDGWSVGLLVKELSQFYAAARRHCAAKLPDLPLQFGDYALWQREWLDDAALSVQLDYWRERLGGEQPVLRLPADRRRRGERDTAGGRLVCVVPNDLTVRLRRLSQAHEATLFMTLLAAFAVLLARYSDQHDLRIGVPMVGRLRPETAGLIGFFVNTVVVRSEFTGATRFSDLLAQVRERVLEAQAHQDVPFSRLVEVLQPERSLSYTPLFQVMFNFEQGGVTAGAELPGLAVSGLPPQVVAAQFDLTLNVLEMQDALQLSFDYAHDLFDRATIGRLSEHYVAVLEELSGGGDVAVGEVGLGGVTVASPAAYSFRAVTDRIVERAAADPARVAVCCEGEQLSYGELEAWSSRIARRLMRLGVAADERVGLCVARSPSLVAGLLGVLKAGAAFVPLDPAYPVERLRDMIEDAGVRRVVADRATAAQLADLLQGCEIAIVTAVDDEAAVCPRLALHPQQLAYVIYTSGSTGRPKGVAISHGALSLHLDDFISTYGIGASDVMLHSSTINFDVALHEILPALTRGGRLVMRGPQMWDLDRLSQVLADEQVTFSRIPTAYWQQWLQRLPDAASLPRLRQVTVGGEGLPGDALRRWQTGPLAHVRLDNLYGPTETTIAALFRQTSGADADEVIVPIGVPYPGRSAIVLDADGNPVPVGGFGELCIGGESVARGYLNRAGLTAERFVPDPFGAPGSRLYRSGDLCRRRVDGTIEFLGRLDQQVKLRGFRIELGEIEAVLRRCSGVKDAVAALKGEGEGRRLVGYVVGEADPARLQAELSRTLPAHMVPSDLMVLEALPLMPNGKIDRAALPEPEAARTEPVAPRSSAEATLLSVWRRVLKRDDIGVTDNFFALGGDSILSLQVIARAREAGLKLTPKQLFGHPTIAASAALAQPVGAGAEAVPEIAGPLPLTPIQARFFELHPEGPAHWNQAVLLHVPGGFDALMLDQALVTLVARHDALRLRFDRSDEGGWRQRVAAQERNALIEEIDLGDRPDWTARLEAEGTRLQQSLDLARGPLLKAGYFRRAGHDGRLLLAIHHLAVDGVSWRVLLQELQQMLGQIERGEAVSLPPAGTPWSVWTSRLAAHAQRPEVAGELDWWQQMLSPAGDAKLPVEGDGDHSLGASQVLSFRLDAMATKKLLLEAPRAYRMRLDEVLLTALARTLAAWSGQGGALIHLEGHGREDVIEDVDLSRTVGWFTTRYPVWLAAGADDDAMTALLDTKERLRAIPHKGFQFGLLNYLGDAAAQSAIRALPQPEVSFNYLGQIDQDSPADGRFALATEHAGLSAAATNPMTHLLDLNGRVTGGVLSINWRFSPAIISAQTVQHLVDRFAQNIQTLVDHCGQAGLASNKAILSASLKVGVGRLPGNIVRLNELGGAKVLFCLHPGYGLISEFKPLAGELDGFATVYGLQSPIFSEPAWRAASFDAMAADYADRIRRIQPEGPYHLLGWSFGGRLAVSIARHLESSRCDVALIGLVDIGAPIDRAEATEAELRRLKADLPAFLAAGREIFRSEVGRIIAGRRTPSGDLTASDEQRLIETIAEVVADHRRLLSEHQYPRIDNRIHVWWAAHPPKTPEDRDWRACTSAGVEVVDTLEATHATIIRHPDLAAQVRAIMSGERSARAQLRAAGRVSTAMVKVAR